MRLIQGDPDMCRGTGGAYRWRDTGSYREIQVCVGVQVEVDTGSKERYSEVFKEIQVGTDVYRVEQGDTTYR